MTTIRDATFDILRRYGLTTIFANPGSTEVSLLTDLLDAYTQTVLRRVWRAQHFSYWMTSMLHRFSDASDFDLRRQLAELDAVTGSPAGSRFLAENYVGLPLS